MLINMILTAAEDDVILRMDDDSLIIVGGGDTVSLPKPSFGPEIVAVEKCDEIPAGDGGAMVATSAKVTDVDFDDPQTRLVWLQCSDRIGCRPVRNDHRPHFQAA